MSLYIWSPKYHSIAFPHHCPKTIQLRTSFPSPFFPRPLTACTTIIIANKLKGATMRMSCNGCRVLRKGCSEDCTIRPCLQWIKNPESQANATVFLAKFYGRAGLLNLINAGPDHLRPAIFRSLLYEACGRIVNPVYGSVGLLWSGNWQVCQAAVEAVLKGAPITQMSTDTIKSFDIRHVAKGDGSSGTKRRPSPNSAAAADDGGARKRPKVEAAAENESSTSHESGPLPASSTAAASSGPESEDTADGSMVTSHGGGGGEVELDLTLWPARSPARPPLPATTKRSEVKMDDTCTINLALDLTA